jgi:4-amino-4-deoxy-L-arabinose transferase-like glycosyltransferase
VPRLALAAVALAQTLVFVPIALLRSADGDEGYYLLASELVMAGELPYRDFMYTQMPLLPYLYGVWTAVFGETWLAARLLSVLFAVGVGVLLFEVARRRFGRRLAIVGVTLYTFSGLVITWLPTVKTYSAPTFFLFAAFALADRADGAKRKAWFAAGLLVALAVGTRLIFAGTLPAFAWAALRAADGGARTRALGPLTAGFGLGIVPALGFLVFDPGRFVFDNLGYHSFRSSAGLVGNLRQKARVAENLLGSGTPDGGVPQFLLLLVAAAAAVLVARRLGRQLTLSLAIAALLGAANFLPTPTYTQYFVALVPFLVVGVLELAAAIGSHLEVKGDRATMRALAAMLAVGVGAYVLLGAVAFWHRLHVYSDDRIGDVERVVAVVDRYTEPGEQVLSAWPGYVYGSGAVQVSGLENDYAPTIASALSEERARHHRLLTAEGIEEAIVSRRARVIVLKIWHHHTPTPDWEGSVRRGGYKLVYSARPGDTLLPGEAKVYALPDR